MAYLKRSYFLLLDGVLLLVWLAGVIYLCFIRESCPVSSKDILLFSCFVLFSLGCAFTALASRRAWVRLSGWLYGLFFAFIAASVCIGAAYYAGIGQFDMRYDVYAVLQSNLAESLDFFFGVIYTPVRMAVAVAVFGLVLLVIYGNGRLAAAGAAAAGWRPKAGVASFLCLGLALALFSQISSVKFATNQFIRYHKSLYLFNRLYGKLENRTPVEAVKEESGELYVLIIGESQNRDLMGCYNGVIDNTPWMSKMSGARNKAGFTVFDSAYASHVLTMQVLRMALSEGSNLSADTFAEGAPNIISIARDAGFRTVWLSNQMSLGKRDNDVSALAHTADVCFFTEKTGSVAKWKSRPDGVLLPEIEKALEEVDFSGNTLLVVHLMGNHFDYKDRYPPDYSYAPGRVPALEKGIDGDAAALKLLEEYLTSVHYIDQVMGDIHALVERYGDRPVAVVYFADHGEELYDRRGGGHNPSTFTWNMSRVPMWTWLSSGYTERYPQKAAALAGNAERVFSNDHIYMLFLGLANIKTAGYRDELDISSPGYSLNADETSIFNGMKLSDDPGLHEAVR